MPSRAPRPCPAPSGTPDPVLFTVSERELIRRELHPRCGQDPAVADGIMLHTWRGRPKQGRPKLPPTFRDLYSKDFVALKAPRLVGAAKSTLEAADLIKQDS